MEKSRVQEKYLDIKFPSAFSSIRRFYISYKKEYPESSVTYKQVKQFIQEIPLYQQHVQKREKFPKRKMSPPAGSQSKKSKQMCVRFRD